MGRKSAIKTSVSAKGIVAPPLRAVGPSVTPNRRLASGGLIGRGMMYAGLECYVHTSFQKAAGNQRQGTIHIESDHTLYLLTLIFPRRNGDPQRPAIDTPFGAV